MTRRLLAVLVLAAAAAVVPATAQAEFSISDLQLRFEGSNGSAELQAGSHPFAVTNSFTIDSVPDPVVGAVPTGDIRDLTATLPAGLVADRDATRKCTAAEFRPQGGSGPACALATVIGTSAIELAHPGDFHHSRVYNLVPPPGVLARIGFAPLGLQIVIDLGLSTEPPYLPYARLVGVPAVYPVYSSRLTLWGVPADPAHDAERGGSVDGARRPFLTLPRSCNGPLSSTFDVTPWLGETFDQMIESPGLLGCERLSLNAGVSATPTSKAATSPTGLDFSLDVSNPGLANPDGVAGADVEKTVVTLPERMTVNPSQAEGLEVCSEADLARETLAAAPGEGCPGASKIGSLEVESPLLEDQVLKGSLFVAKPYENTAGDSLLALYIVIKDKDLGILVKQPARVDPDPVTGQLTTTAEDMPQLPFSHFRLHFREGARSPLVTPPDCGTYDGHDAAHQPVRAVLYPSTGAAPVESTASFEIVSGPDNAPCPSGGLPPFHPNLLAGTVNNAAGAFSPFNVKLTRSDSEQEITHFSIKLPPGVAGKLAGIPFCSDAAIALAQSRTGPHGGQEELDDPSCPAASQVGRTLAGAGVGPSLTYAAGRIYLAGPYHGHPLSLVAITSGVVGPFDIGTVVVRLAIDVNPETGEVFLDSTGSDPIPHIIKGIPVHLRDIRAYTDRPEFTFNPTSCEPMSTAATVLGSGLDFAGSADDNPFVSTSPFQAADCAALPFKPKLGFRLRGGTKRGAHPSLRAHVAMSGFGEAAISRAQITLPHSEFLEQGHIGTICTRVQYNSGAVPGENCPAASVYGRVRAKTPILDGALEGPIFLRSSEHKLPDLVASLHHAEIDVTLVGRIDAVKGQIRNTFELVPDAPVTSADFIFGAGKKSLLVNSTDICRGKHKVLVDLKGHNGKRAVYRTPLKAKCKQ